MYLASIAALEPELMGPGFDAAVDRAISKHGDSALHMYFAMRLWLTSGKPVFHLEGDLAEALALTDYDKLSPSDFGPPFGAFGVKSNRPFGKILDSAFGGGYIACREFLASVIPNKNSPSGVAIGLYCFPEKEASDLWALVNLPTDVFAGWEEEIPPFSDSEDEALRRTILRIFPSLCLYLSEQRVTTKPPRKPHPRRRPWSGYYVGGDVRLPQIRRLTESRSTSEPLFKLKSRFVVRGHWRNQPCGKGRTEVKRIWVRPFWKGEGESLTRTYSVGKA